MPKPKTRLVREYEEPSGIPDDAVRLDPDEQRAAELAEAQVPDEEIDELFRVSDEMRTTIGVMLQIVRVLPVKDAGYVGEMAPAEFTLQRMREQFGVGKYRVRVMGPKGYVPGGGSVTIATVPEKPVAPESSVENVLAILKADKEANAGKLKEWAQILTPLMVPVIAGLFQPKNQVSEMVQGLAALQGLQPKPEKPPDFNTQFDNILQLTAKIKDLAGEEKSTTGATWIDLIRDGIKGAQPLLEGIAGRLAGAPGALPSFASAPVNPAALPALLPASPAPSVSSPPSANGGGPAKEQPVGLVSLLPWLNATLQFLIDKAARNKDPDLYAEVTLDSVPDGVDAKALIPFLERPDWWQQLQSFSPQVAPYPAWFEDYRNAVLALLKEEAEQTAPTIHPPDRGPQDDSQPMAPGELDPGDGM